MRIVILSLVVSLVSLGWAYVRHQEMANDVGAAFDCTANVPWDKCGKKMMALNK